MNNSFLIRNSGSISRFITHIILIGVCFIWMYPFLWMVSSSFKTDAEFFENGLSIIPNSFNMSNIIRAWETANFSQYFLNTFIITFSVVLIVLASTSACGYALGRFSFPGKKVIYVLLVCSMFIPLEFSIIPIVALINALGLSNTMIGVILAESGGGHVMLVLMFASYFAQIPKEMEESATMDGCGFLRTFVHVMLPLAKPIIGSAVIMQVIFTWNSFLLPLILTLSNPSIRPLSVGLYAFKGENVVDWTGIAAGATISVLPVIIIFIVLQKYFVEGISGAVKG
ncbi:carbohydrate ABC transporter permease [Gracilibacillus sp. YIM 98692]|uniref:carbohydrate ABC transporter permease n=1 Tax=Gracilibacillus sp. YIM 98692 TaxID=2663532 RepID=UPI0013D6954D|nr:carbohydrate ABC transporter permease [Gracilibacillus sp. YIM 98692]